MEHIQYLIYIKSKIYIKLHQNSENILLTVGDNGLGIPEDVDLEHSETLGLRLVRSLVDQLDGTVELHGDGGTEFRIIFAEINQKLPLSS